MSGQEPDAGQVTAAPPFAGSAIKRAAVANPKFVDLSFAAKAATDNERSMTLLQGIKLYPKAVGWSMLLSTCIVMEGYDLVLLGRLEGGRQWRGESPSGASQGALIRECQCSLWKSWRAANGSIAGKADETGGKKGSRGQFIMARIPLGKWQPDVGLEPQLNPHLRRNLSSDRRRFTPRQRRQWLSSQNRQPQLATAPAILLN
ncbi:hypothetical protein V502_00182, partial [Pseudogymnoascus sp. VKM F-4520 (FW-2644)]